jgi:hypothetical protein
MLTQIGLGRRSYWRSKISAIWNEVLAHEIQASNDDVWNALQPALKLINLILANWKTCRTLKFSFLLYTSWVPEPTSRDVVSHCHSAS